MNESKIYSPTQQLVAAMYKNDKGEPIILTDSQDDLFSSVAMRRNPRIHCMSHTRWGKSMTVGLAALTRVATFPEKWAIIAGTKTKSKIIMDYVINHIFDNEFTRSRFMLDKGDNAESIRRHRNKSHLTFKVGKDPDGRTLYGEVFIGTAADALGFGAQCIIEDEAALIPTDQHSLVIRMLGDNLNDNFLIKIGNPFNREHFLTSYHDPTYKKIVINCYKSLKEGRITEEIIEENRPYSFFKVLYECKFPSADEQDLSGWMYLLKDEDIANAIARKNQSFGTEKLGLDVARGGRNFNCWVGRTNNVAQVLLKNHDNDPINIGDTTINFMRDRSIPAENVFVDDTGIGWGITGYLRSKGAHINPVNFGYAAEKDVNERNKPIPSDYINVRAEVYAGKEGVQTWIKQTGQLVDHKDWKELLDIRYKKNSQGKTQIEPKDDMRKRGVESPDVADALALTFAKVENVEYHGIDPEALLAAGAVSEFGGVGRLPGVPG